jgi:hypothetical protein
MDVQGDIGKMLEDIVEHASKTSKFLDLYSTSLALPDIARKNVFNLATYARECLGCYRRDYPSEISVTPSIDPGGMVLALGALDVAKANICAVSRSAERLESLLKGGIIQTNSDFCQRFNRWSNLSLASAAHSLSYGIDVLYDRLPGQGKPSFPGWSPR